MMLNFSRNSRKIWKLFSSRREGPILKEIIITIYTVALRNDWKCAMAKYFRNNESVFLHPAVDICAKCILQIKLNPSSIINHSPKNSQHLDQEMSVDRNVATMWGIEPTIFSLKYKCTIHRSSWIHICKIPQDQLEYIKLEHLRSENNLSFW